MFTHSHTHTHTHTRIYIYIYIDRQTDRYAPDEMADCVLGGLLPDLDQGSSELQGYQSVQLGSISECESVSPALVEMKVTTRVLERQQQDKPLKRNTFAGGGHRQLLSPYPSWLIFFNC